MPTFRVSASSPDIHLLEAFLHVTRTTYMVTFTDQPLPGRYVRGVFPRLKTAIKWASRLNAQNPDFGPLIVMITTSDTYYYVTYKGRFIPPLGYT